MVTDGKITAPVGLASTANFFGVASDVMTVCQASVINKWAKYKPIALASMGKTDTQATLTEAQRKSAEYGLTVKSANSMSTSGLPDAIKKVTGEAGLWTYLSPVTGTDYARLDDFTGYEHASVPPCQDSTISDSYDTSQTKSLTVYFSSSSDPKIRFDELNSYSTLGNCYLCLAFQYNSVWYYIFSTDTVTNLVTTWSDEQPSVDIPVITDPLSAPFSSLTKGKATKFTGYLFLIDLISACGTVPDSYKGHCISATNLANHNYYVYSLPFANAADSLANFSVTRPTDASTGLTYSYELSVGTSTTTITLTATNNTKAAATVSNLFVYLMSEAVYDSSDFADVETEEHKWSSAGTKYTTGISFTGTFGTGVYARYGAAISNSSITIAAGKTQTCTITFNAVADAFGNEYNEWADVAICAQDSVKGRTVNGIVY